MGILYITYSTFAKFYNLKKNCLFLFYKKIHIYYKNEQKMRRNNKVKLKTFVILPP